LSLDLFTTSFVTAVVVIASGVVFLLDTVMRRESGSGRYWAAAFVVGMLVTFCYVAWTIDRGQWVAIALGNAGFVSHMGLMWLGCRVYNGRLGIVHRVAVAAAAMLTLVVSGAQREVGDWAAAPVMFALIGVFALLGALETMRGALRAVFAAWGLTFVFAVAAAFFLARTGVFLAAGPDSPLFTEWFGTTMTSLVTIVLTIVAVVSTSVLRVVSTSSPAVPGGLTAAHGGTGLLPRDVLTVAMQDIARRSERAGAPLAILAIRIGGLAEIAAAFGPEASELIEARWHDAVYRHLPLGAPAGALDDTTAAIALTGTDDEAAATGNELRQGLIDELASLKESVLPSIGVGFALAEDHGYDADVLVRAAVEAAERSATSSGMPVVRASGRGRADGRAAVTRQ
jgi:GGDEF domain-containing protein